MLIKIFIVSFIILWLNSCAKSFELEVDKNSKIHAGRNIIISPNNEYDTIKIKGEGEIIAEQDIQIGFKSNQYSPRRALNSGGFTIVANNPKPIKSISSNHIEIREIP